MLTASLILLVVILAACGATKVVTAIGMAAIKYLTWFFGLMFVLWCIGTYMYP